jgi:hypothetical protein
MSTWLVSILIESRAGGAAMNEEPLGCARRGGLCRPPEVGFNPPTQAESTWLRSPNTNCKQTVWTWDEGSGTRAMAIPSAFKSQPGHIAAKSEGARLS